MATRLSGGGERGPARRGPCRFCGLRRRDSGARSGGPPPPPGVRPARLGHGGGPARPGKAWRPGQGSTTSAAGAGRAPPLTRLSAGPTLAGRPGGPRRREGWSAVEGLRRRDAVRYGPCAWWVAARSCGLREAVTGRAERRPPRPQGCQPERSGGRAPLWPWRRGSVVEPCGCQPANGAFTEDVAEGVGVPPRLRIARAGFQLRQLYRFLELRAPLFRVFHPALRAVGEHVLPVPDRALIPGHPADPSGPRRGEDLRSTSRPPRGCAGPRSGHGAAGSRPWGAPPRRARRARWWLHGRGAGERRGGPTDGAVLGTRAWSAPRAARNPLWVGATMGKPSGVWGLRVHQPPPP